jgi:thioredoxin reductase
MNTTRDVISDVLVIGAGAAGLTAALVLARARHRVTVIEDHTPRNATVEEFHGFPTRDGSAPDRFRTDALAELQTYGVSVVHGTVSTAVSNDRYVSVTLTDDTRLCGDTLVVATGVHDELPPIAGLADRWGTSVFNCPFCEGWEHRDQPVLVIDAAPGADHLTALVRSWTPHVTVVTADDVESLVGDGTSLSHATLHDGQVVAATAAFVKAPVVPRSSIARMLGCDIDQDGYIVTSDTGATSHPLVWAAGDVRRPPPMAHQVLLAAADGSAAAIAIHKTFVTQSIHATNHPPQPREAP